MKRSPMPLKHSKTEFKNILVKSFQFIVIFIIAFLLESVVIPQFLFIEDDLPEVTGLHKVQNRLAVIFFLLLLLFVFRKKYKSIFAVDLVKSKESYIWITATLFAFYIIMQMISGFNHVAEFRLFPLSSSDYIQLLLIVVLLVPIQEEFLYRGLLLLVPDRKFKSIMLLVSSVLFGLLHDHPFEFFWMGLGLGILALRFNTIWIPIIAHALWNFVASFIDF
jgi:uncharacterized protein